MKSSDLNMRLLFPCLVAMGVLLIGGVGGTAFVQRATLQRESAATLDAAQAAWNEQLTAAARSSSLAASFITEDRKAADAMGAQSKSKLAMHGDMLLDRMRQTAGITELTFLDSDLNVFAQAGGQNARDGRAGLTAGRAKVTRRNISGIDTAADGAVVVRTVHPWINGGKLLGFVQVGTDAAMLQRGMQERFGVQTAMLLDKRPGQALAVPAWAQDAAGDRASLFPVTLEKQKVTFVSINDANGQTIGRLAIGVDVSGRAEQMRATFLAVSGASLAIVAALSGVLWLLISRLRWRLDRAKEQLDFEANHDVLTGLPNRRRFIEYVDHVIQKAPQSKDRHFAVLFLDFDRFKMINDTLGHAVGDALLQTVVSRIRQSLARTPAAGLFTIGRLGGDEFVVLLDPLPREQKVEPIIEQLQKDLSEPYQVKGHEIESSVCIGMTSSESNYTSAIEMIRDADTAMQNAKTGGRGTFAIFQKPMRDESIKRLELERDLGKAAERNELRLYYQPIVSIATGKLVGFESLVRWQHPTRGFVSPADFIPAAEETGEILQIGNWVLAEGCRQLRDWREGFPELNLTVSINLSRKQLCYPDLVQRVQTLLVDNAIPAGALKLEITESTVMEHGAAAIGVLQALQGLGVHLWMDDFGTGYSSLSCLHRFPLNGIKVDRAFIRNVSERSDYAAVVQSIVSLAGNLGMHVVAEGVETIEQLELLQRLECHLGQGYYFSKPVDAKAAEAIIQKHTPLSRAA